MKMRMAWVGVVAVLALGSRAVSNQPRMPEGSELLAYLGVPRPRDLSPAQYAAALQERFEARPPGGTGVAGGSMAQKAGQPQLLSRSSAFSAAMITTLGGRDTQFSEVSLLADWDGREDHVADRSLTVDDFSFNEPEIDFTLTRAAISHHTIANGYNENVYYYGDSIGNLWIGTDLGGDGVIDALRQVNIPTLVNTGASGGVTLLNPQASDCTSDQVVVTGLAVNPVVDLGDYALCETVGEVIHVSVLDTDGCAHNAAGQPFRTRIFSFGWTDGAGAGALTPVGAIQVLRNHLSNVAGVAVDEEGSLYFHLCDLNTLAGGAIFKVTEGPRTVAGCALNPRVNRTVSSVPSGLSGSIGINTAQGTGPAPILTAGGMRLTNYSGPSTTFGNVVAIASGPRGGSLYAAVARSFNGTDDPATQATEGPFTNPAALGPTPSMVIAFQDVVGSFDTCSPGAIPIGEGLADVAAVGLTHAAGVNNFRVFVHGTGPDLRAAAPAANPVSGNGANTLKVDLQIDFTLHAGLMVDEEGTLHVISGGTPAGVGRNPSPGLGEILAFPDSCPVDARADFIDLRGNNMPNPPASGGNVGDGDSDRFDHLFHVAPLDGMTLTPTGLAGLSRGFLVHLNRTRNNAAAIPNLPNGTTQGDDATSGPLVFEDFDAGHQVAGGDDQTSPFRGDDTDGAGDVVQVGLSRGGFEFAFGGPLATAGCVHNAFFLNSNGNVSFLAGDTNNVATEATFLSGPQRIAPAWFDLLPSARAVDRVTFPVQALGFSGVNAFKVRWINVPQFGPVPCTTAIGLGGHTFSVTLYDDGTSRDENEAQVLDPADPTGDNVDPAYDEQEGPTDLRFLRDPVTNVVVGAPPRPDGSGFFCFDYGEMIVLGTPTAAVITGYSVGGLPTTNPPALCETDLSEAARAADVAPFGPCRVGRGIEPSLFERFDDGTVPVPTFDLRQEGHEPSQGTPAPQPDMNRGRVCFAGVGCAPPPNPLIVFVQFAPFVVPPDQTSPTSVLNALCDVIVDFHGVGLFPTEAPTICEGTGTARPGASTSTSALLEMDENADAVVDATVALANLQPIGANRLRGTLVPLPGSPGTAFPLNICAGTGTFTVTTTFTAGDDNVFGPFARSGVGVVALGNRAPVVLSVTPNAGDATTSIVVQLAGDCFAAPAAPVTSVIAVDQANPANVVPATSFVVLNRNQIDATFDFGAANAGRTFRVHAVNAAGRSRNLVTLPVGAPVGCPLGNEQGNAVTIALDPPPVVIGGGGGGGGGALGWLGLLAALGLAGAATRRRRVAGT